MPKRPRSHIIVSFVLFLLLPGLLLGENKSNDELDELTDGREIPFYAIDGFKVRVFLDEDFPYNFGSELLFKSQIELALDKYNIKEFYDLNEILTDSGIYNVTFLDLSVDYIDFQYTDGTKAKIVTFIVTLSVEAALKYRRYQRNPTKEIYALPEISCNIWHKTLYGTILRTEFKKKIEEILDDNLTILINDYKKMNSKETHNWIKRRQVLFESLSK